MSAAPVRRRRRSAERGLTLVELLVALTVGLFVVAGYTLVVINTSASIRAEGQLRDWQEAERMAFNTIGDIVAIAGYYPVATSAGLAAVFPGNADNLLAGTFGSAEYVSGTTDAEGAGDSIALRFIQNPGSTASTVATTDCNGNAISGLTATVVTNMFTVNAQRQLTCTSSFNPNPQPLVLVSGVQMMRVLYGVDVNGSGSVGRYLSATEVGAAGAWSQVRSMQVTLTFVNPLAANPGQPPTLALTRVMPIRGST